MSNGKWKMLWLRSDRRFAFQLAPAHYGAANCGGDGLDHDVVHHLAIAEALQEQPPKQTPALFAFEYKGEARGAPIHGQKQRVVKEHLLKIRESNPRRLLGPVERIRDQRIDQHQIHDRRDQRKQNLKYPDVAHRYEPKRAVPRPEY